jgi:hypothetical protein
LLPQARDAFDFLTLECGFNETDSWLTAQDMVEKLEVGSIGINDLRELIRMADEAYAGRTQTLVVQGEVVEPGTAIAEIREDGRVVTEDGEVLELCERLGFTPEAAKNHGLMDERKAAHFIEKIRSLQNSTVDIIRQAKGYFDRNKTAIQTGMRLYGPMLRDFTEPKLPRYTRDTKNHKAGDLKEHSVPMLTGDVCFRGTGGPSVERKYELDRYCANQLLDLTEEIEALCEARLAALPEPLKSIIRFKWEIKADSKAALKAVKNGASLPGIDILPRHDTDRMMIGTGRKPFSLTKEVEAMTSSLKKLREACTEEESEDA